MDISNNFEKNNKPSEESYETLRSRIDFLIDEYYLEFMEHFDGAEGFINDRYLAIWSIADVLIVNKQREELIEWEHYFCIGSDGSGQTYAFDKRDGSIVYIDPFQLGESKPENYGKSFKAFLGEE